MGGTSIQKWVWVIGWQLQNVTFVGPSSYENMTLVEPFFMKHALFENFISSRSMEPFTEVHNALYQQHTLSEAIFS